MTRNNVFTFYYKSVLQNAIIIIIVHKRYQAETDIDTLDAFIRIESNYITSSLYIVVLIIVKTLSLDAYAVINVIFY